MKKNCKRQLKSKINNTTTTDYNNLDDDVSYFRGKVFKPIYKYLQE